MYQGIRCFHVNWDLELVFIIEDVDPECTRDTCDVGCIYERCSPGLGC